MDRRFREAGATMTMHDSKVYLAWANSLSRLLNQLGLAGAPERTPTLAEIIGATVVRTPGTPRAPFPAVAVPSAGSPPTTTAFAPADPNVLE
jgi:hypothetical protein